MSVAKRIYKNLMLSVASLVVTLFLIEVGLRLFYEPKAPERPEERSPEPEYSAELVTHQGALVGKPGWVRFIMHPYLIYKNFPNQHNSLFNINSLGFRGEEVSREKGNDVFRILMLGGSVTFGFGSTNDQTTEVIVIANRTADRAKALAAAFAPLGNVQGVGFRYLAGGPYDLVINATSASLTGEIPDVPVAVIGPETFCYDMAYGKGDTPFVRWCVELGCRAAASGWGMLVEQAAESFRLWRGVRPLTGPVRAALTSS